MYIAITLWSPAFWGIVLAAYMVIGYVVGRFVFYYSPSYNGVEDNALTGVLCWFGWPFALLFFGIIGILLAGALLIRIGNKNINEDKYQS